MDNSTSVFAPAPVPDTAVGDAVQNMSSAVVRSYLFTHAALKANGASDEEAKAMAWCIVGRVVDFVDHGVNGSKE